MNKLCALLGRSELRDLVDVRVMLEHGLSLDAAVRGAAIKDGGFSPLRDELSAKLTKLAAPDA